MPGARREGNLYRCLTSWWLTNRPHQFGIWTFDLPVVKSEIGKRDVHEIQIAWGPKSSSFLSLTLSEKWCGLPWGFCKDIYLLIVLSGLYSFFGVFSEHTEEPVDDSKTPEGDVEEGSESEDEDTVNVPSMAQATRKNLPRYLPFSNIVWSQIKGSPPIPTDLTSILICSGSLKFSMLYK